MALSDFFINGAPGGSSSASCRRCADAAGPLHLSSLYGLPRVLPDLRKPKAADSANAHHFTQRKLLTDGMNCSVHGAAPSDTISA